MRRHRARLSVALALVLSVLAATARAEGPAAVAVQVETVALESRLLARSIPYRVALPAGLADGERVSVVEEPCSRDHLVSLPHDSLAPRRLGAAPQRAL